MQRSLFVVPGRALLASATRATPFAGASVALACATPVAAAALRGFAAPTRVQRAKNPYKVLNVPAGASAADIKKAYRVMALKYHPDSPGGSHEKFQEVQLAYEQVKSGVWIPKDTGDGSNPVASRFGNFRYKTASKDNVTFDQFMRDMHAGDAGKAAPSDASATGGAAAEGAAGAAAGGEGAAGARRSEAEHKRASTQDFRIQAWFRLLALWAVVFLTLRIVMLVIFPPKVEKKARPNPARHQRAPPPPPPPARLQARPQMQ
jgi:hypothetical protein